MSISAEFSRVDFLDFAELLIDVSTEIYSCQTWVIDYKPFWTIFYGSDRPWDDTMAIYDYIAGTVETAEVSACWEAAFTLAEWAKAHGAIMANPDGQALSLVDRPAADPPKAINRSPFRADDLDRLLLLMKKLTRFADARCGPIWEALQRDVATRLRDYGLRYCDDCGGWVEHDNGGCPRHDGEART